MQAPHPPQKKTAQRNKVWAKETSLKNWATNGFIGDSP
jgi:hypothetical protein